MVTTPSHGDYAKSRSLLFIIAIFEDGLARILTYGKYSDLFQQIKLQQTIEPVDDDHSLSYSPVCCCAEVGPGDGAGAAGHRGGQGGEAAEGEAGGGRPPRLHHRHQLEAPRERFCHEACREEGEPAGGAAGQDHAELQGRPPVPRGQVG